MDLKGDLVRGQIWCDSRRWCWCGTLRVKYETGRRYTTHAYTVCRLSTSRTKIGYLHTWARTWDGHVRWTQQQQSLWANQIAPSLRCSQLGSRCAAAVSSQSSAWGPAVETCQRFRPELRICPGKEALIPDRYPSASRRGRRPAGASWPAKVGTLLCCGWKSRLSMPLCKARDLLQEVIKIEHKIREECNIVTA